MSNVKEYIDRAVQNIESDRATTNALLVDAMIYLKKNEENHKSVGPIVAKYLETLQRSNEQLVKLTSIMAKKTDSGVELSEEDKKSLFDVIQGEKDSRKLQYDKTTNLMNLAGGEVTAAGEAEDAARKEQSDAVGQIAGSVAGASDRNLKKNITKIGKTKSGLNNYYNKNYNSLYK